MPALGLLGALGLSGCDNPRTTDGEPPNADALDAMACASGPERNGPYTRVTVAGEDAALGIIDPSVDYEVAANSGLMTYTAVPSFSEVHIAIATSDDAGLSWRHVSDVTESRPLTISTDDMAICGSSSCDGTLAHESSSLIVDAFDPDPNRRLKVFAHSYFFGLERQLELGYLALYTAARPEGPWTETPLLGWPSSSTVTSTPVAHDISSDPSLQQLRDCLIIGEPGALVRAPGTIDLALACVRPEAGSATIDIRLLRSLDHATTWTYVGTLLSPEDAQSLGATSRQINGADLFYADDAYHLIATPIGLVDFPDGRAEGYRGCVVVPITDLDAGQIARCNEEPIVEASYLGQPGQFVGACSADAGSSASGLFIPVPDLASAQPFQLFAAQMSLP